MGETHNEIQSPFLESAPLSHLGNKMTSGGPEALQDFMGYFLHKKKKIRTIIFYGCTGRKKNIFVLYIKTFP